MTELSVVVVHRSDTERAQLEAAFAALSGVRIAGERPDLRAGLALAHSARPDILVLELAAPLDEVLAAASHFRLEHPDTAIFFVTEVFDPDVLLRAMRAGAQEILRRPLDRGALTAAVERIGAMRARRNGASSDRRVIAVFSGKGGSGVSTVATNLAIALRRETGRDVALADFDHQSGDAAFLMGLTPARSVSDVLMSGRLESAVVQDALARHPSGVCVLAQPEQLDKVERGSGHQIGSLVEILSSTFDFVVIDCPHAMSDGALEVFDRTSTILLVVEPTVPSVRAAKRALEIFHGLDYLSAPDKVRLVLNRLNGSSDVTTDHVTETLGLPVFATVASDYEAVVQAVNSGRPVCEQVPDSPAARDLAGLARRLVPGAVAPVANGHEPEPASTRRPARFKLFGRGKAS